LVTKIYTIHIYKVAIVSNKNAGHWSSDTHTLQYTAPSANTCETYVTVAKQ